MKTYRLYAAILGIGLCPSLLFAQFYRMDVDLQSPGTQYVIDRVFTGNTVGLDVGFYDGENPFFVTNWTMAFRYGYGQYDTNGMVTIYGVASSNRVVFNSTTNLYFGESDSYYFSISGIDDSGLRRTFARGRMIEEYDPATAGTVGVISNGLYFISWGSIFGNPASNAALTNYIAMFAGADSVARAGVSSNSASIVAVGAVASNALPASATNGWEVGSHAGLATTGMILNASGGDAGMRIWVDSNTNYYAASFSGAKTFSSTSFSAAFMWAATNNDGFVIELQPLNESSGTEVGFEIDAPIHLGSLAGGMQALTIRGHGNIGTMVGLKSGYAGSMFTFSNMWSILRIESIRFQGSGENTNPVLRVRNVAEVVLLDDEFTSWRGPAMYRTSDGGNSIWNIISRCWFVGNRLLAPAILLEDISYDQIISDCHFLVSGQTTQSMVRASNVNSLQVHGCRFLNSNTNSTGLAAIELLGGVGQVINDNTFQTYFGGDQPIRFIPSASNRFGAVVSGNNFSAGWQTNAVWIGANSHDVTVIGNAMKTLGGWVSTVNADASCTGIWSYNGQAEPISVASLSLGTNAAVSNWPSAAGGTGTAGLTSLNGLTNPALSVLAGSNVTLTVGTTSITVNASGGGGTSGSTTNNSGEAYTITLAATNTAPAWSSTNAYWAFKPSVAHTLSTPTKADTNAAATVRLAYNLATGITATAAGFDWPSGIVPPFSGTLEFYSAPATTNWTVRIASRRIAGVPSAYDDAVSVWWPSRTGSALDLMGRNPPQYVSNIVYAADGFQFTNISYSTISFGQRSGEASLEPNVGDYTMSAWVYPTNHPGWRHVMGHGFANTGVRWSCGVNSTSIYFEVFGVSPSAVLYASSAAPTSTWSHVVATIKHGEGIRVYLNGNCIGTNLCMTSTGVAMDQQPLTYNYLYTASATPFVIGNYYNSGHNPETAFQGRIDAAAVARRAWTDAEVLRVYSIGRTP